MKEFIMSKTAPIVQTPRGQIRGFRYDGVDHFYGIRYAKAKRFQMPEPIPAWDGVKDANSYGMICPLLNEPTPTNEVITPHRFWPASEHCQYLNVWTKSCDPAAKRPVMFWIHGGGYTSGSSIEHEAYDGFRMAKNDDIVFVSVNHRLNAFGHLDLSDYGEKYRNSVNVGMADLVEALRWVRDNIASFGGDPDNVTIFGQSGGSGKVTILAQIPEAEGLFHKMIIMSGVIPERDFSSSCTPKELVQEILKALHLEEADVEKLEKVPTPQFIWAVNKATRALDKQGKRVGWSPRPNEYYTCDPLSGEFSASSKKLPTIVGTVLAEFCFPKDYGERDELSAEAREQIVRDVYGEGAEQILKLFREFYPGKNEIYATELDTRFLPASVEYTKKKAAVAEAPVYNYMFGKIFNVNGGTPAGHCSDIPFFLHNTELLPICQQPHGEELERVMSGAFVNFARTGDPNTEGLPHWEPCAEGKMVTMVFDDECAVRINMQDELLPLVQKYQPPFHFNFPTPDEEDEESGSAWVY